MKDHPVSVYQDRYSTSIVAKYLDTTTIKIIKKVYKTTFPSDIIFTKDDAYTSDEEGEKLTREFNIHYRAFIGSLIYLVWIKVDLSSTAHKLGKFSSNSSKVHFEVLVHLLKYIRYNKTLGLKYYADMEAAPLS